MIHSNKNINNISYQFEDLNLEKLDGMNLLNRFDTKFILNYDLLLLFLSELKGHYKILEINGVRNFNYHNLYFDTPDIQFYNDHHNGKVNRSKVRFRHYFDVNKYFFEIKTKTSPSFTFKNRIKQTEIIRTVENKAADLVNDTLTINPLDLKPMLEDTYDRITLASEELSEKITIDTNLVFKNDTIEYKIPDLAFIEIKQKRVNNCSPAFRVMKSLYVRPQAKLSKYCIGMVLTRSTSKYNQFKNTILNLNKFKSKENGFIF